MVAKKKATGGAAKDGRGNASDEQISGDELALQILEALDVGVLYWSADGVCELLNHRALAILELDQSKLAMGMSRDAFMTSERDRGVFSSAKLREHLDMFELKRQFRYDCLLPSQEVANALVRPVRGGGHLVTFNNVTEHRNALAAVDQAKAEAMEAQREATEVLGEERARQREARALAKMDEWLQSCKSLDELYTIVTAFMKKVLPGTRGQLFVYSNSRDVLDLACTWNCTGAQENMGPDSCWALRRGRDYVYDPNELSFVCDHVKDCDSQCEDENTYTCVPIIAHGDTVGLLHIQELDDGINPEVMAPFPFASRCAEHISMAIANVKLRDELQDQSTRDPLTGLYNRRYFLETIRREINRASSSQGSFALLSFDADRFKKFNDEHGHDAGDVVLEAVAEKARGLDYSGATACRVGGEEFCIILPGADRTKATSAAEDLRQSIEETRVKYVGGRLPKVTVSIGISVYPTHGTEPMELIKQADVALYDAKKAGRNCWRFADAVDLITF